MNTTEEHLHRVSIEMGDAVLTLSRLTSLRFAFDPAGFLTAGRAAAARSSSSAWAFYLPTARRMLGERVTALSTRKHAEAVLSPGASVMLDGEVLAPLLGRTSSLLDLPGAAVPPRVDVPAPSSVRMAREDKHPTQQKLCWEVVT